MVNKLGIIDYIELKRVEYVLTNFKYRMMDINFMFNESSIFSIDYLEKIHIYLFQDIYDEEFCKIKDNISVETLAYIQNTLYKIKEDVMNLDIVSLSNDIYTLWEYQMFVDGNTRTIRAFLKIVCLCFDIKIKHNFDEAIYEDYFIGRLIDEIVLEQNLEKKKLVEVDK